MLSDPHWRRVRYDLGEGEDGLSEGGHGMGGSFGGAWV